MSKHSRGRAHTDYASMNHIQLEAAHRLQVSGETLWVSFNRGDQTGRLSGRVEQPGHVLHGIAVETHGMRSQQDFAGGCRRACVVGIDGDNKLVVSKR